MLRVSYDGTDFHGWQLQQESRTVESELNRAITEVTGEKTEVIGASRTDAGVHAKGNVAVFDTNSTIPGDKFMYAVNNCLPEDVAVTESLEVCEDFHPRHCDCVKTYEYRIYEAQVNNPLKRRNALRVPYKLDTDKMAEAAKYLVGEHDFKSFCSVHTQAKTTVRTVYEVSVEREKDEILITVKGGGFLYNMVRIIAGTLIEVGRGKIAPERVAQILDSTDRTVAGPTAEPQGLTLARIEYTKVKE